MIFYAITDRKLDKNRSLFAQIKRLISFGVDWIQIREKDLSDTKLLAIAQKARQMAEKKKIKIFISNRADIAHLANCDGIHLSSDSIPTKEIKKRFKNLLVIKSCHSLEEIKRAKKDGADFVTLSPIFETKSKESKSIPLGLKMLNKAVYSLKMPIVALGGVDKTKILDLANSGAYGIAGIGFFYETNKSEFQMIKKFTEERK
ncbi:MAG: thiamine phosphate synthase [Acidobacteria bacterium]|nr:thiamine phosphate synthase [Acidobacteriota bacterium]